MPKAARIKSDLDDVSAMVEIFQILKDVAANHFYNTAKRKEAFVRFADSFVEFFKMVSLAEAKSPLVQTQTKRVGILAITSEGGFMADMTAKVIRTALKEAEKHGATNEIIVIGAKGKEKLRNVTGRTDFTCIEEVEEKGLYKTTLEAKECILQKVKERKIGKVFCVYPRAMSLEFIKPFTVKLLPSEELITQQMDVKDVIEKVIVESNPDDIINHLADVWLTCRLYEMLEDCVIAGFAAQSQQLEASLERLKKDQKGLMAGFRKAKKGDIDQSLREVFTASKITQSARR
ncbi:MAG: F0F1 ATP synthase subunit gamma [Candidatus Omnitrophota bacterium]